MNEFLNPKSMLTPGVAGALMMFLVNGIGYQFPELSLRYLGLVMSFLIGSVVWFSDLKGRAPMVQKGVYWVLNSLVIFVVGFGTTNLAVDVTSKGQPAQPPHAILFLAPTSAYAAPTTPTTNTDAASQDQLRTMNEKLARERAENERLKRELKASRRNPPPPPKPDPQPQQQQFFKRW